jgi:hypothetical protein
MTLTPDMQDAIIDIGAAVLKRLQDKKTMEQYTHQLRQYARDYYTGKIDDSTWLDKMLTAITEQVGRAWNEGMRANGLDPAFDMDEDYQGMIDDIIKNEQDHVTNLSDLINNQRTADAGMDAIYSRCDMWAARYTDVVNQSKLATSPDNWRFVWIYGDTQHCSTCLHLNGKILTAKEWRESGFHPQQPPNPDLECGGWRCKCRLERTKKKRTGL